MPLFAFANNVSTTLAAAINSTATTIELASAANFPSIPTGYVWAVTLNDQATGKIYEIVYATAISGNNLTVLRGQENTTARAWNVGDFVFAADTAGILSSFVNSSLLSGYVELDPPSTQSGSINISGSVYAGASGNFSGVSVGGMLTSASTGNFSQDVTALDFIASRPYANTAISALPLRLNGNGTLVGVGPSSGLSANTVTASVLAIAAAATGELVAIDYGGNIGATGDLYCNNAHINNGISATTMTQSGQQVVNTLTSTTLSLTKTGSSYDIEIIPGNPISLGGSLVVHGNNGSASLTLPNYGSWFVEVLYGLHQTSNNNLTIGLTVTGGTLSDYVTNGEGTAFNSQSWITLYGRGQASTNNQTIIFGLSVSGGSYDTSNAPWTVRATRTS